MELLEKSRGDVLSVTVMRQLEGEWSRYKPFEIEVAPESIDPFVAYRLIPPGYETWSKMGLYQRNLTNFREHPIIENKYVEDNCVNCHSFSSGNPENVLFHIRGSVGGTMIKRGEVIEKVDLKREGTLSAGVYPSWHPSGDYIAFSTNKIEQHFHASMPKTIEVHDRQSDLILYHIDSREVIHVPGTRGEEHMETYPSWSPDGKHLYFSRSDAKADTPFDSIRYDIYRISFDPEIGQFGAPEPVLVVTDKNKSASFPRVSPDGRYLLCTLHDYGTFSIWHPEADLCLADLETGKIQIPDKVNSDNTESFHSWSSNGRWVIFSSRRDDGQYTRLYISYFDQEGLFHKPFILPMLEPSEQNTFLYSYNRPELIRGPVTVKPREWVRVARQE
jgi:dipeptidyl aminopeptidase/acylaminoacyl peptidase